MKVSTATTFNVSNLYSPNWLLVESSASYRRALIEGLIELLGEKDAEIATLLNILNPPTGEVIFAPGYDGDDGDDFANEASDRLTSHLLA